MSRYLLAAALSLVLCGPAWAERPELTIEISGVSDEVLRNVQHNLGLYLQRDHPLLSDSVIRRLHRQAPGEIRLALEPFGYYRPSIDAVLDGGPMRWTARYRIDPGPPLRVAQVNISLLGEGAQDPALLGWRDRYPIRPGDVLHHGDYEEAKQALQQLARERGYFGADLRTHRVTVDLRAYHAIIDLEFDSGARYAFGEVDIGHEKFDEGFLRRYLTFQTGDPYDARKLLGLRRALADSDYFDRADVISLVNEAEDGRVPIEVDLEAKRDNRYSAGLGYSTDTGARARLGFERRRANVYGHRYNTILQRSEIESSFSARYYVPLRHPVTDYLSYSLTWLDENTVTTDRTTTSVGVDVTQQTGAWLRTAGVSFEQERYRVDIENDASLVIPHVRWQRVSTERRISPAYGWIFTAGVRGASDAVLSDTSFLQPRVDGKYITTLWPGSRLLLRAAGGFSWVPEFQELPASQRFFAGGDQSIRGYAFNALGPENDEGVVIGGRNLLVGSVEYEIAVRERMAVAAFFDAGNAFNDTDIDVEQGAGLGLRWRTPIGAIRIDFAQALTRPGNPWRLHITLGPDL